MVSQWRFVYQIQLAHLPPNEDLWFVLFIVIEVQICVCGEILLLSENDIHKLQRWTGRYHQEFQQVS